jgi:hypothetical protein
MHVWIGTLEAEGSDGEHGKITNSLQDRTSMFLLSFLRCIFFTRLALVRSIKPTLYTMNLSSRGGCSAVQILGDPQSLSILELEIQTSVITQVNLSLA